MTFALPALLLLGSLEIVSGGQARVYVAHDGSEPARRAAALLRNHVVWMTGVALPDRGAGAFLRFERDRYLGWAIEERDGGCVVHGDDPVRAAYDILGGWGCRFDADPPEIPKRERLALAPASRPRERTLWVEGDRFDPSIPARGVAVSGLDAYRPERFVDVRALGYEVRVASTSFDDFLAPDEHFAAHPEWFALRDGERVPRGNFALGDAAARAAYLDRVAAWLQAHPEVACLGLWPEVTRVWDEAALAVGAPLAYATLWREAAARFPDRRFEILATAISPT